MTEAVAGGVCVWFTGLSGAGKTTTARAVIDLLTQQARRAVLLDGDEIRATQTRNLGFSKADRDANVMHVASLASQVVQQGDIAICALVSPYRATRAQARAHVGHERFVEVFVDAPLEVCEARDPKGLYAKARRGSLTGFTGIDDPYERPIEPDLVIRTAECSVEHGGHQVVRLLADRGFCGGRWP